MVRDYHPSVVRTGRNVDELIDGTAFFPGGSGLWRDSRAHGPLPEPFPEGSIMFVAHNFDSINGYDKSKRRGGESKSVFWKRLLEYLNSAGLPPDRCFFTNALMGFKPGSAVGKMPTVPGYEDQCQEFLARQIEIVQPSRIVALGREAEGKVRTATKSDSFIYVLHPSAWALKLRDTRCSIVSREGRKIANFVSGN